MDTTSKDATLRFRGHSINLVDFYSQIAASAPCAGQELVIAAMGKQYKNTSGLTSLFKAPLKLLASREYELTLPATAASPAQTIRIPQQTMGFRQRDMHSGSWLGIYHYAAPRQPGTLGDEMIRRSFTGEDYSQKPLDAAEAARNLLTILNSFLEPAVSKQSAHSR